MQLRNYVIRNEKGDIVPYGIVEVFLEGTDIPAEDVFDGEGNLTTNPFTANEFGRYSIRMPNGTYTFKVRESSNGGVTNTRLVQFLEITNVDEINTVADSIDDVIIVASSIDDVNIVASNIADVNTVAGNMVDVANFAGVYYGPRAIDPVTRRDGSALEDGDLYYNTTKKLLRTFNGVGWQDVLVNAGTFIVENFSGDNTETEFDLSSAPADENNTQVYISGVYQNKSTYSITGTKMVFVDAPPAGSNNIEVVTISTLEIGQVDAAQVSYTDALGTKSTVQTVLRGLGPVGALIGVTAPIQDQLDGKSPLNHTHDNLYEPLNPNLVETADLETMTLNGGYF